MRFLVAWMAMAFAAPALANDTAKVVGTWKLVSFMNEFSPKGG